MARGVASALCHLHEVEAVLHGDIKSANVLASRDLTRVKVCDLGVSLPLAPRRAVTEGSPELRPLFSPELHIYQGTEPWRPPETFCILQRLDLRTRQVWRASLRGQ